MNNDQWQAAWLIFDAARSLTSSGRRLFVESKSTDPEVVQRVFEMLESAPEEDTAEPPPVSHTGERVGRYFVGELLGRGGMGEVYAARDLDLDRPVALKFLLPQQIGDRSAVKRFVREAKAASALNHPNILTVHEIIQTPSSLAIAMEMVQGKPLSEFRGAAVPLQQAVMFVRQVAVSLAAAHEVGIVHRDIKPENLMLRPDGFVKVLDFGLAYRASPSAGSRTFSSARMPGGTLRYMSPEQLRGEPVTGASDVFSLGIVLYELAAGRHPFESEYAWETAYAIHTRKPTPPSAANRAIPAWLDDLIL
jgi:serine/threonine protein kinase